MQQPRKTQPFEFKSRIKNRFNENSYKYYRRKTAEEQKDKKKLKRTVRLRRIHLNRYISVKYKGGKWWDKMMQIFFGQVEEQEIKACSENTTSDAFLNFTSFISNNSNSQSFNEMMTFKNNLQYAAKDVVRIIFHGIVGNQQSSSSSSSSGETKDIYLLLGFKYKVFSGVIEQDECYITGPQSEKPSKKLSTIKIKNLQKQHDLRAQYRVNAQLIFFGSIQDERTIFDCFSYQRKFKKHNYSQIDCQLALLPQQLQQIHSKNISLWKKVIQNFQKEKQLLSELKNICDQTSQVETNLACRNRLLFFKRGFNDKTQDELQQALQELQLEEKRLIYSRKIKKNTQLASYNDCKICFNPEIREDNLILFCNSCKISFHLHCYGLKQIENPLLYICDACEQMQRKDKEYDDYEHRPHCQICYSRQEFPLKQLKGHFYHVSCLFIYNFVQTTSFNITLKEKVSKKIKKLSQIEGQNRCEYCIPDNVYCGIRLKCTQANCGRCFHPICAYLRGCKFQITRKEELQVSIKCSYHTYQNEDDEIRQVYMRRFFCNFQKIQKLNEEQFKPLYREEISNIVIERRKCQSKDFCWQQYDPPLKKRRIQEFESKKIKLQNKNLSIEQLMNLFSATTTILSQNQSVCNDNAFDEDTTALFFDEQQQQIDVN